MCKSLIFTLLFLLTIFFAPKPVFAGNSGEFKVSSFIPEKFTDLTWTIGGRFGLAGSGNDSDTEVAPGFEYSGNDSKNSYNQQDMNLKSSGRYVYETVNQQFNINLGFKGAFSHRGNDSESSKTYEYDYLERSNQYERDLSSHSISTNFHTFYRQYLSEQFFGQLSFYEMYSNNQDASNNNYSYSLDIREYNDSIRVDHSIRDRNNSSDRITNTVSLDLTFGLGHLYEGSFASTAMYLIDKLKAEGLIRSKPSKNQMIGLTEIIYYYRMKHAIDDRLHRQEALSAIVDYLEDERITQNLNSQAHFAIQDIWDYYPNGKIYSTRQVGIISPTPRLFGIRVKAGVGYRSIYERRNSDSDELYYHLTEQYDPNNPTVIDTVGEYLNENSNRSEYSKNNETAYLLLSAEYHNPINHLWQLDLSANTSLNLKDAKPPADNWRSVNDAHYLNSSFRLSRFFDSRTTVTASINSSFYFKQFDAEADSIDITYPDSREVWDTTLRLGASIRTTYRLTIPTTLSASFRYDATFESHPGYAYNQDRDYHKYSLSAEINHFIY